MTPHHVDSPKGYEILKLVLWLLCCYEGLLSMCCFLVLALLFIYFSFDRFEPVPHPPANYGAQKGAFVPFSVLTMMEASKASR
jgi:hypothetical protein